MRNTYLIYNGAAVTTAALVPTATGTAIETHLQVLPIGPLRVLEWGISFDGTAAATPIRCELIHTGTIAATVTAHVAAGVQPFNDPNLPTPSTYFTLSTTGTGFNASAEGTIVASRMGDLQLVAPTNQYVKQFPLGEEFQVPAAGVLRIRTTSTASVGCYCYAIVSV